MEIIQLGSMYFDETPLSIGNIYTGGNLIISNTVKGKEVSWVNVNGLLVADHVICIGISWDILNKQGLIFGRKVTIDGTPYLCRSLKVGNNSGVPNEWDDILDATSEDDSLWHWKNIYFWGQETSKYDMTYQASRGFYSARYWNHYSASFPGAGVGFRPVLEPLVSNFLISDSLVGTTINVFGNGGTISGVLCGLTDYDLFLSPTTDSAQIPSFPWYCQQSNGIIVVDRSSVEIFASKLLKKTD